MFSRAGRAALLQRKPFTEAFFDTDAAADGAILVATVAAAVYVGTLARLGDMGRFSFPALLQILIASVASWLILAVATWFAASKLFGSGGRPQIMIALHGLAALPLLLETFGEAAGGLIAVAGLLWYLVVLVVATREASDLETKKAAVSVLIGFAAAVLVRALINAPFVAFSALTS
jgi:hypothetical protein